MLSETETKLMLEKEEKVKIKIRKERNNANYITERVYVNGHPFLIDVGKEVEVPLTIAKILEQRELI